MWPAATEQTHGPLLTAAAGNDGYTHLASFAGGKKEEDLSGSSVFVGFFVA